VLDAALISIAALASGAEHGRPPLPADSGLTVAALGCRPLVLVLRESPYGLPLLRNMVAVAEAGAIIVPASPSLDRKSVV
jgi:3-polyprenyl-4-hydroxybenzoate decarboxylase